MTRVAALWDEWAAEDPYGDPIVFSDGAGRSPIDFGPQLLRLNVYLALGADLTANPNTWVWTDVSSFVLFESGINTKSGRQDESSRVSAGMTSLTFDNRDGRFSRKNPNGPYYGRLSRNTPIWVTLNAGSATYSAVEHFVNEWPGRWDKTQTWFEVPIKCSGILRRLTQDSDPLKSVLYRSTIAAGPVAYWPLEGGADAASGANAVAGGTPMTWTGTAPTRASGGPPGSDPLWTIANDTDLVGIVGDYTPTTSGWWGFQFVFHMDAPTLAAGISLVPVVEIRCGGTIPKWRLTIDPSFGPDVMILEGFDSSDARVVAELFQPSTIFGIGPEQYGHDIIFGMNIHQEGGNIRYDGACSSPDDIYGGSAAVVMFDNTIAGTNGNVTAVRFPTGYTTARPNWVFGHVSVWGKQFQLYNNQMNGYSGESAFRRIARLCAEEGVHLSAMGDLYDPVADPTTEPMGPQTPKAFIDLIRECEAADGGVLWEREWGLAFQPRWTRYRAPYGLVMDVSAGHIADEMEPTDDDQRLRNRWTISRTSGSSAVAEDTDSIAAEGLHKDSATLNVETDSQLQPIANWALFLGLQDDLRWPAIGLGFHREDAKELIDQWIAMQQGGRVLVNNVPGVVDAEPIDAMVEGKSERFDQFRWSATLNTSPGRVNDVMRVHGSDPSNLERIGLSQTLTSALNTTDTTFQVSSPGVPMADTATYPEAKNYPITIGGEVMLITDVSGATSPQTLTVVRSVNGVVKTHSAGDALALYHAGVIGR